MEVSLSYSRILDGRDMPTNWMFCWYLKIVFTLQYRQHNFFISFLATCIYFVKVYLFCIILSAREIQCDYLYDGNKKDTLMLSVMLRQNWVQKKQQTRQLF